MMMQLLEFQIDIKDKAYAHPTHRHGSDAEDDRGRGAPRDLRGRPGMTRPGLDQYLEIEFLCADNPKAHEALYAALKGVPGLVAYRQRFD
jgi:hypothetical protein